ncbi:MAG: GFA family protein [Beijerinckiaceae bacterium]
MTDATPKLRGGCLCGDVRYEIAGKPRWVAHCHCESCRRAMSGAFATWVGLTTEQWKLQQGEVKSYTSSPGALRSFCPRCGAPLTFVGEKWPDEIHVLAGSLDDPAAVQPQLHVNAAEGLPWADIHDALPRFAHFAYGAQPVRVGPRKE